jgi:hypothetical protein
MPVSAMTMVMRVVMIGMVMIGVAVIGVAMIGVAMIVSVIMRDLVFVFHRVEFL